MSDADIPWAYVLAGLAFFAIIISWRLVIGVFAQIGDATGIGVDLPSELPLLVFIFAGIVSVLVILRYER